MVGTSIGKYRFVAQLGRGGMGTVYKAVDDTLDREVAIKVLNPELADTEVMTRFRAEATTLARLNHPHIATIYELYRRDHDLLMVMEFVKGETLERLLERCGPLAPARAADIIDRVLSALEHAHRAGIVHRDLKPANVMVTEQGTVKIMDFGIARVAGAEHMTQEGYMMGTPAYMAPEQVLGHEVDGRADLYSVGVVFYRLLTGRLPFEAETTIALVQQQLSGTPTPLQSHRGDLPEWCSALLRRVLAKAPADRFATAEEFRAALTQSIAEWLARPAQASPTTPGGERATPSGVPAISDDGPTMVLRRRPFPIASALLSFLIVGVAAAAIVSLFRSDERSPGQVAPLARATPAIDPTAAVGPPAAIVSDDTTPNTPPAAAAPAGERAVPPPTPAATPGASSKPPAGAPAPLVPLVYDARTLVAQGDEWQERSVTLLLADRITLTADRSILKTISYSALRSVHYSQDRQPLWNSPRGPEPVVRVRGGALDFLRGDRRWITLRTARDFTVIRVDDGQVFELLHTLEERTGRPAHRVSGGAGR